MRVAVIGGGISGLVAAYRLQRDGALVTLVEAGERLGGHVRTAEVAGCLVEHGPNGFLDDEPATLELVDELGLGERLVAADERAARRLLWRGARLREVPSSPPAVLRSDLLAPLDRLRLLAEAGIGRRRGEGEESVHDFAVRRFGKGAGELLAEALVTGVFAGDPRRLALASAYPRLAELERLHGSLLRGMARAARSGTGRPRLRSFDRGMALVVETLAERLADDGAEIRLGVRLDALPLGEFDHVVCAVPAARAAELAQAKQPTLAAALGRLPAAPVAVVAMVFAEPLAVDEAFGFLAPHGGGLRLLGCVYDSSIFSGRAPDGLRLFRALVGGRRDPTAVDLTDAELLELVARDLRRAWGVFPEPVATRVLRHRPGIAQYELGHAARLAEIEAACPPELTLVGASYRGVSFNACIREAGEAARRCGTLAST